MPSRRDLIRMSDAEIREYLATQRQVVLVTNGPRGMPHPVPMEFGLDTDGSIVVTSFRKGQKLLNLQRDARATLLFDSGTQYQQLKGVIAYCDAQILEDAETVAKVMHLVRPSDDLAASMSMQMSAQVRASLTKRVAIRFKPFRFVTWDHGKLPGVY
jgi:nitroimidazol reductase NimA-like FMN-containing flavoprotein (pyridoxamine 5'-phosphate oxidase superfamily)